jgi:polyhydroxybutyrate depolymerase
MDDRDVKLFDALLARLRKEHKIDERRIYAAGFSNGGFFTYTLWAVRGDVLAAVAPCACLAGDSLNLLKPKPCLHLAGVAARLQFQTIAGIRRLNKCGETGVAWNPGPRIAVTYYDSPSGTPFVSVIHSGGHILPQSTGAWIVRFFKAQVRP